MLLKNKPIVQGVSQLEIAENKGTVSLLLNKLFLICNTPHPTNVDRLSNIAQTRLDKPAHTITETKTEITKKQTQAVVVNLDIFAEPEKQAASKFLSTISPDQQIAVLAVMMIALGSTKITNKIGYLRAIVHSVHNGSFTPAIEKKLPKQPTSTHIKGSASLKERKWKSVVISSPK